MGQFILKIVFWKLGFLFFGDLNWGSLTIIDKEMIRSVFPTVWRSPLFYIIILIRLICFFSALRVTEKMKSIIILIIQWNFSGSNTDGSFTTAISNSSLNSWGIIP